MRELMLLLGILVGNCAMSADAVSNSNRLAITTGPTIDGLALGIQTTKAAYSLTEPIWIKVTIRNHRTTTMQFTRPWQYTPVLRDAAGHLVTNEFLARRSAYIVGKERVKVAGWLEAGSPKGEIAPGKSHEASLNISGYYDIKIPGVYRLILLLRPAAILEELLFSNPIQITVRGDEKDEPG